MDLSTDVIDTPIEAQNKTDIFADQLELPLGSGGTYECLIHPRE